MSVPASQPVAGPTPWLDDLSEDWIDQRADPVPSVQPTKPKGPLARVAAGAINSVPAAAISATPSPVKSFIPPPGSGVSQMRISAAGSPSIHPPVRWPASRLPRPNNNANNNGRAAAPRPDERNLKIIQAIRQPAGKENNLISTISDYSELETSTERVRVEPASDGSKAGLSLSESTASGDSVPVGTAVVNRSPTQARPGQTLVWRKRLLDDERGYNDRRDLFSPHGLENIFQRPKNELPSPAKDGLSFLKGLGGEGRKLTDRARSALANPIPSSPPPWPASVDGDGERDEVEDENADLLTRHSFDLSDLSNSAGTGTGQTRRMSTYSARNKSESFLSGRADSSLDSAEASFSEVPIVGTRVSNRTISGLHYRAVSNASAAVASLGKRENVLRWDRSQHSLAPRAPLGRSEAFSPAYMDRSDPRHVGLSDRLHSLNLDVSPIAQPQSRNEDGRSNLSSSGFGLSSTMPDSMLAGTPESVIGPSDDPDRRLMDTRGRVSPASSGKTAGRADSETAGGSIGSTGTAVRVGRLDGSPDSVSSLPSRSPSPNMAPPGSRMPMRYRVNSVGTPDAGIDSPGPGPSRLRNVSFSVEISDQDGSDEMIRQPVVSVTKRAGRAMIAGMETTEVESQISRVQQAMHLANHLAGPLSAASPAKASLPKRRRTHLTGEQEETVSKPDGMTGYVALNGAGTGSRQSSVSSIGLIGFRKTTGGVKQLAGQKRKDARYSHSDATRADEEVLRQRAITQPGRVISPRNKDTGLAQDVDVSAIALSLDDEYDQTSGAHFYDEHDEHDEHYPGDSFDGHGGNEDLESSVLSTAEAFLSSEIGGRLARDIQTGRVKVNSRQVAAAVAHFSLGPGDESAGSSAPGSTRQRKRSVTTQDFFAEAVKIMDIIRQRRTGDGDMDGILEESDAVETDSSADLSHSAVSAVDEASIDASEQHGEPVDGDMKQKEGDGTYGLDPRVVRHVQRLQSGSYYGNGSPNGEVEIAVWGPPTTTSSTTSSQRQASQGLSQGLSTRLSTAVSTGSRRSDTCNVATLAPEAVAHLIPTQVGAMVFDEARRVWQHRRDNPAVAKIIGDARVDDDGSGEASPDGLSLDRIPDLSVDESRERVFLRPGRSTEPEDEDGDDYEGDNTVEHHPDMTAGSVTPSAMIATTESTPRIARPGNTAVSFVDFRNETQVIPHDVTGSDDTRSTGADTATGTAPADYAELSHFLSEMPDFSLHQTDELVQPMRTVVGQDGHVMVESRYLRSTGALIRALQASTDSYHGWTTLEQVSLRAHALESLYLLKEFCKSLVRLDVADNNLRHVLDVGPGVRALDVSNNKLTELAHWGSLVNLQFLDVSHNRLKSLVGLSGLIHLRELVADHNGIDSLRGLDLLDGLEKVSVRSNAIVELDFTNMRLDRLAELDVGSNPIRRISGLDRLPRLTSLSADDGDLDDRSWNTFYQPGDDATTVPETSLSIVRLCRNRLRSIDCLVRLCPRVRRLYLDGNALDQNVNLDRFRLLERVSIRGQKNGDHGNGPLTPTFPPHATAISLSRNRLQMVPAVPALFSLVSLEIAFCGLDEIPADFAIRFPNLERLNLNYNAVSDLAPLLGLGRLVRLDAAGNRISRLRRTVAVLARLDRLELLDLRDNPVTGGMYPPLIPSSQPGSTPSGQAEMCTDRPNDCTTLLAIEQAGEDDRSAYQSSDGRGNGQLAIIPISIDRWTADPSSADDEYAGKATRTVELPNVNGPAGDGDFRWSGSKGETGSDRPDKSFVAVLDQSSRLRRAVYRVLVAASCSRLERLDGRNFDRRSVWAEIGVDGGDAGRAGPNGSSLMVTMPTRSSSESAAVWRKLVELGVVKRRDGKTGSTGPAT